MKNKVFKIVVFLVVLLIPLIYSFFYLKSYWDPYGNLKDMKIAIVNLDEGNGEVNQGENLANELISKDVMDFCKVSKEEAENGLENEEYYAVITIPSNFSKCLVSAGTDNKQVAKITYTPNQQKNYLASQIINKVVTSAESSLESKISKEVVSSLTDTLNSVPDKMEAIYDGANQIGEGAEKLNLGLNELSNGISLLNEKYNEFDNGVKDAYNGSTVLNDGMNKLNSGIDVIAGGSNKLNNAIDEINKGVNLLANNGGQKINELNAGIETLNNGANSLNLGVSNFVDGSNIVFNGIKEYTAGVAAMEENENAVLNALISYDAAINSESITNPQVKALADNAKLILAAKANYKLDEKGQALSVGANQLISNSEVVKNGAKSLSNGMNELKNGTAEIAGLMGKISTLQEGVETVKNGTNALNDGVVEFKNGTNQVNEGTNKLEGGLAVLSSSSSIVKDSLGKLNDGSISAVNGSSELLEGTNTFKEEINKGIENTKNDLTKLEGLNDYVENPVVIEEVDYGKVDSYGIAFTPLFISIGLWVGALMCYVVLYYDQKHRFGKFDSSEKNKMLQNILYIGVGLVEGLITGLALKVGLNFEVASLGMYLLECSAIGAIFMIIIQFLVRNFGDVGKFLALIILVLQLAASGGTFPVETIDKGFRFLNPLLPMTYSIKIFKECLIETSTNFIGKNTILLFVVAAICLAITMIIEIIKNKKQEAN